jgi:hypothetical protein
MVGSTNGMTFKVAARAALGIAGRRAGAFAGGTVVGEPLVKPGGFDVRVTLVRNAQHTFLVPCW